MGVSDYSGFQTQKSKKFYTNLSGLNSNQAINENIDNSLVEKILLKVSINNIKKGCKYKIKLFNINENSKNPLNEIDNCKILENDQRAILNTPILIDYYFEKEQPLLIEIIIIEKHIPIEFQIKTTLGCIMGSIKNTFSIKISSSDNELILEAE